MDDNFLELLDKELRTQEAVFTDTASKNLAKCIENLNAHLDKQNKTKDQLSAYIKTCTDVRELMELTIAYKKVIEVIAQLEEAKQECINCLLNVTANHLFFTKGVS